MKILTNHCFPSEYIHNSCLCSLFYFQNFYHRHRNSYHHFPGYRSVGCMEEMDTPRWTGSVCHDIYCVLETSETGCLLSNL